MVTTRQAKKSIKNKYTIRGTNKTVRVKDCVLLRPIGANKPTIACVEKFVEDNMKNVRVRFRRYYRPEETIAGRRCFHGDKELFLSDHRGVHSADIIEGKCSVHTFKNYKKLESVGVDDYFCRFWYKASTGDFTPNCVPVFCKCKMPDNPDMLMVLCESCKERYHPECVGMPLEEAMNLKDSGFVCSECSSKSDV